MHLAVCQDRMRRCVGLGDPGGDRNIIGKGIRNGDIV